MTCSPTVSMINQARRRPSYINNALSRIPRTGLAPLNATSKRSTSTELIGEICALMAGLLEETTTESVIPLIKGIGPAKQIVSF
jgi:hypothetical protein